MYFIMVKVRSFFKRSVAKGRKLRKSKNNELKLSFKLLLVTTSLVGG